MLGVPSRSDAMVVAPDYAEAVAAEKFNRGLETFKGIFSTIFPHNHVAEAYRDTGNIERFISRGSFSNVWDIRPRQVPRAAVKLLKPELVRDHYLNAIRAFRTKLEEARSVLDCETWVVAQNLEHKPYAGLHDSVAMEECAADYVYEGNAIVRREGKGKGWKYTFNPYVLAMEIIDEFERAIISLYDLERTKIEKITAMTKVAYDLEEGANFRLAEGSMRRSDHRWPISIEHDEDHPVHRLVVENREIGEKSDLWLRFDELYFMTQLESELGSDFGQMQIPASGLLDGEYRMMYYMLGHRVSLRRVINRILADREHVTINGVAYEKAIVWFGGEAHEGYMTNGQTYQELVDLLGRPVQQPDGTLVTPEAWAKEEVELVEAFLDRRDPEAIETLLERYELDTSNGNPSREKMLDQLEYSCSPPFI